MLTIFDCDGVLVDSEIIAARVDSQFLREAGYEISPEELAVRFAGSTMKRIFETVEAEIGRAIPDELLERAKVELDVRLGKEVQAVDGAAEMLDQLDYARCVCSNSSTERLKLTMDRTGLYDRFRPYIYSAKEVRDGREKPAPDVFLHALDELDIPAADALVIEDSVHGIAGATAAGLRVIGFTGASHSWPGHAEALMDAGAITTVARMADIPATIDALFSWRKAI